MRVKANIKLENLIVFEINYHVLVRKMETDENTIQQNSFLEYITYNKVGDMREAWTVVSWSCSYSFGQTVLLESRSSSSDLLSAKSLAMASNAGS